MTNSVQFSRFLVVFLNHTSFVFQAGERNLKKKHNTSQHPLVVRGGACNELILFFRMKIASSLAVTLAIVVTFFLHRWVICLSSAGNSAKLFLFPFFFLFFFLQVSVWASQVEPKLFRSASLFGGREREGEGGRAEPSLLFLSLSPSKHTQKYAPFSEPSKTTTNNQEKQSTFSSRHESTHCIYTTTTTTKNKLLRFDATHLCFCLGLMDSGESIAEKRRPHFPSCCHHFFYSRGSYFLCACVSSSHNNNNKK